MVVEQSYQCNSHHYQAVTLDLVVVCLVENGGKGEELGVCPV